MTERDRMWWTFLKLRETREYTIEDIEWLCVWWHLRGAIKRRTRKSS